MMKNELQSPIRYRDDGSIDTGLYVERGLDMRCAAMNQAIRRVAAAFRTILAHGTRMVKPRAQHFADIETLSHGRAGADRRQ